MSTHSRRASSGTSNNSASGAGKPAPAQQHSACHNCRAKKLRCSGEKSGCSRCSSKGVDCVYEAVCTRSGRSVDEQRQRRLAAMAAARSQSLSAYGQGDLQSVFTLDLDAINAASRGTTPAVADMSRARKESRHNRQPSPNQQHSKPASCPQVIQQPSPPISVSPESSGNGMLAFDHAVPHDVTTDMSGFDHDIDMDGFSNISFSPLNGLDDGSDLLAEFCHDLSGTPAGKLLQSQSMMLDAASHVLDDGFAMLDVGPHETTSSLNDMSWAETSSSRSFPSMPTGHSVSDISSPQQRRPQTLRQTSSTASEMSSVCSSTTATAPSSRRCSIASGGQHTCLEAAADLIEQWESPAARSLDAFLMLQKTSVMQCRRFLGCERCGVSPRFMTVLLLLLNQVITTSEYTIRTAQSMNRNEQLVSSVGEESDSGDSMIDYGTDDSGDASSFNKFSFGDYTASSFEFSIIANALLASQVNTLMSLIDRCRALAAQNGWTTQMNKIAAFETRTKALQSTTSKVGGAYWQRLQPELES